MRKLEFEALREWHRPLMVNVTLMLGLVVTAVVGLAVDDRMLLGESVWVKPLKFGIAFTLYSGALAWLLSRLRRARRLGWWAGTIFAAAATVEVTGITVQAARGTISHFNANTDPVTVAMTQLFTYGVAGLLLTQLVIAGILLAQRALDLPLTRAVRWGISLSTAGMMVPIWWMATNVHERTVLDANGHPVLMYQGHGVGGDPDGHGMFLTGWSTSGGDFRAPHFIGLHALHVLLLTAYLLKVLGRRFPALADGVIRAKLVTVAAIAYAGLLAVLIWQVARGQSLIHPDTATALGFAAVGAYVVIASAAVLAAPRLAARFA